MEIDTLTPHNMRECKWGKKHECWADAHHLWIQMKFIGTIVSGFRKDFDLKSPHYWLEYGNFVYTNSMYENENGDMKWVLLTYEKDSYYKHHNIRINKIQSEDESLLTIVNLKKRGYL